MKRTDATQDKSIFVKDGVDIYGRESFHLIEKLEPLLDRRLKPQNAGLKKEDE